MEGSWLKRNPREGDMVRLGFVQQHVGCWRALGFFSFFLFIFWQERKEGFVGLKNEAEFWKNLALLQVGVEANLTDIVIV